MKEPTLRLVHSSDLHLERPLHGLAEIPDHLRERLIEAPYHAAEQVFETALAEDVDAVLLAGDVVDVDRAGPPAIVLLLEQFARLGDRGIQIYWAGGAVDNPDNWPRSVVLPENVHVFPVGHVQSLDLARANEIIARVQGVSSRVDGKFDASGFHRDAHGRFTIGVAHEQGAGNGEQGDNYSVLHAHGSELRERVHYMALGGRHLFQTVAEEPGVAHYCGTPHGRGPTEIGAHGCTLVHVDDTGRARPQFVATDSIRWTEQTLEVTATTKQEQLYERLVERMEKLLAKHPGIDLLVQWKIQGAGPLVNRLRPGGLSDEMLVDLRRRFGHSSQIAWSASLECHSPLSVPAEWYDEETVLGDFVRQVRACEKDENLPFDLTQFLPDNLRDESLATIAHVESHDHRLDLLERAAKLGVDLLTIPLEEGDLPADH